MSEGADLVDFPPGDYLAHLATMTAMQRADFCRLYLGEFAPAQPGPLDALAEEYHARTEAYDRTVCTGPMGSDGILPATGHELRLISRHANQVRRELAERAARVGHTDAELRRAIIGEQQRGRRHD